MICEHDKERILERITDAISEIIVEEMLDTLDEAAIDDAIETIVDNFDFGECEDCAADDAEDDDEV